VRLIGVDTPESTDVHVAPEPLGKEATEFTRNAVEGREVRLQFDRERRDAYHRVLAYVWIDARCLNEELIRAGFSRAETRFPYSAVMKRRFLSAEAEARKINAGIWALSP
jgi:micrococcal nuclease